MTSAVVAVLCLLVGIWAVTSRVLTRHDVTGPLLFVIAGYVLANPTWGVLSVDVDTSLVHHLAELALALVLFTDASRIDIARLRSGLGLPVRLLAVGLPLTIAIGTVCAYGMFGEFSWGLALLVGAALAPTDAALSVAIINDERIPQRLRTTLNVESGLNDGIATPVVTVAIAMSATAIGAAGEHITVRDAVVELLVGVAIGVVVGGGAAWIIRWSTSRALSSESTRQIACLAVAVGVFAFAVAVEGNGFIAAFVAGMTFGYVTSRGSSTDHDAASSVTDDEPLEVLPELGGEFLALVVWFLFGAALIPLAFDVIEQGDVLEMFGYAVLSLTVFRMVPVAVSLMGTGWPARDVAIVGWFGPRGLASIVFALLAVEELAGESAHTAVAVIAMTVLLSVIAHGVTAGPVARRYPSDVGGQYPAPTPYARPRARAFWRR